MAPEDWLRSIEDCASSPSVTAVTGSSSSGKSTLAKRLVNRYLTGLGKTTPSVPAVCYMDLDPKKQEYTPGGQISLVIVRQLNLGPSFAHPSVVPEPKDMTTNEIVRAHPIPANLANYSDYYEACVEDLLLAYRNLHSQDSSLPLVVDTPSFLCSPHFDLLNKLLTRLRPHTVVHLGDTRAIDTETAARLHMLQTVTSQYHGAVHEITAQQPQLPPMRTEAELCAMQMQSYFHLKSSTSNPGQTQEMGWSVDPLSHLVPWEFCYKETDERTQDVVGFAMYSEPIEPASLIHALNGSIVQIVQSTSSIVPTPHTSLPRTKRLQIPFFPESESLGIIQPLDPRTTRLICTALIRGFDPEKKVVQVLVPKTHESLLYSLSPERTVFVGGCCDMPEWAYMEDAWVQQREQMALGDAPLWIEREEVVDNMGYLNTVRRVRKFQT
jgi:polynucleotide 5'-hydroxyl-kinase GRC3/NOL9